MSKSVLVAKRNQILLVSIDRPEKKNALTFEMYDSLTQAFLDADEDPSVRVVVLSGQNGVFTAGNDLQDFLRVTSEPDKLSSAGNFLKVISSMKKPVIAAVEGLAIGIGTSMLLHCDLVYCGSSSTFQLPFTRLGVVPEGGTSLLLPEMLGHRVAFELLALGEPFDANRAREFGIVNDVVAESEALDKAMASAEQLLELPPTALEQCKALLKAPQKSSLTQTMDTELEQFRSALLAEESVEAISAILEKRRPNFDQG